MTAFSGRLGSILRRIGIGRDRGIVLRLSAPDQELLRAIIAETEPLRPAMAEAPRRWRTGGAVFALLLLALTTAAAWLLLHEPSRAALLRAIDALLAHVGALLSG